MEACSIRCEKGSGKADLAAHRAARFTRSAGILAEHTSRESAVSNR